MAKTLAPVSKPKKKRLSRAEKAEAARRAAELERYGFAIGDISSAHRPNRFFLCLIRALLIFMASFGMIGALVSSFGLPFSMPLTILGLLVLSFLSAFLYYNRISFYLGYITVFAGFVFFSVNFYWYINSGYQAFMNEVFNSYSDYFRLLSTREAQEFIEDRYLTVTAAMIFMGWFYSILLNITISGYMNLPATFLITFIPLQIAFYVDKVPPLPYLCLLLASYISVGVLGRSGRFTLPYRHEKGKTFNIQRSKKGNRYVYLATSNGMLLVSVYSVLLSSVFLIITGSLYSSDLNAKYVSNPVKDTTDKYVKNVVQGGLFSLLDRYRATGGLAQGRLGGISSVNPDFQTDLVVRMVPNASESVYLKAYTGVSYDRNSFSPASTTPDHVNSDGASVFLREESMAEADDYLAVNGQGLSENYVSKIWISNLDAELYYNYRPYFTIGTTHPTGSVADGLPEELKEKAGAAWPEAFTMLDDKDTIASYGSGKSLQTYEELYIPFETLAYYEPNPDITEEYQKFVYRHYTQFPDSLKDTLTDFVTESGMLDAYGKIRHREKGEARPLHPEDEESLERYKELQQQRLLVAGALKGYFLREFRYTMSPGSTPWNRDTVDYFLTEQRRGFCAHYAASATLLLRRMGIPARYIEGYMISTADIMDSRAISTDIDNWQTNAADVTDRGIVEVEVTDASAHAWVEIYLDGYGWIPYEFTPPSEDEASVDLDFLSLFSNIFTPTMRDIGGNGNDSGGETESGNIGSLNPFASLSFLTGPLSFSAVLLALAILALPLGRAVYERIRIMRCKKRGDYGEALLIHYLRLVRFVLKRRLTGSLHPTIREVMELLPAGDKYTALRLDLESSAYGSAGPDAEAYGKCLLALKAAKAELKTLIRHRKRNRHK